MTTAFPTDYDNFPTTNPTDDTKDTIPSHSTRLNNFRDAIAAIEARVGKQGETSSLSHEKRITDAEAKVASGHPHGAIVTAHSALTGLAADDHPQYHTSAEVAADIATHAGLADPHTGYRLESADHSHQTTGLQGGTLDHGAALTGLGDDDHPQYLKEEASGGTAAEVPDHTHASGAQAGTVAHSALTGLSADDHPQYATDTDLTNHAAAGDPHTGYRLESADHSHASSGLQGGLVSHDGLQNLQNQHVRHYALLCVYPKVVWTNMPAAETELFGDVGGLRQRIKTTGMTQFRIIYNARDNGAAGSKIRIKYLSGAFNDLASVAGAADVGIGIGDGTGNWTDMAAGALNTDSLTVGIFGVGGDAVADPSWTVIGVELRP